MAHNVGGIYGTIGMDVSDAVKNINKLKGEIKSLDKIQKAVGKVDAQSYEAVFSRLNKLATSTEKAAAKNAENIAKANKVLADGSDKYTKQELNNAKKRVSRNQEELNAKKALLAEIKKQQTAIANANADGNFSVDAYKKSITDTIAAHNKKLSAIQKEQAAIDKTAKATAKQVELDKRAAEIAKQKADAQAKAAAAVKPKTSEESKAKEPKVIEEDKQKAITQYEQLGAVKLKNVRAAIRAKHAMDAETSSLLNQKDAISQAMSDMSGLIPLNTRLSKAIEGVARSMERMGSKKLNVGDTVNTAGINDVITALERYYAATQSKKAQPIISKPEYEAINAYIAGMENMIGEYAAVANGNKVAKQSTDEYRQSLEYLAKATAEANKASAGMKRPTSKGAELSDADIQKNIAQAMTSSQSAAELLVNDIKLLGSELKRVGADAKQFSTNMNTDKGVADVKQLSENLRYVDMLLEELAASSPQIVNTQEFVHMERLRDSMQRVVEAAEAKNKALAQHAADVKSGAIIDEQVNKNLRLKKVYELVSKEAERYANALRRLSGSDAERGEAAGINYDVQQMKMLNGEYEKVQGTAAMYERKLKQANYAMKHLKATGKEFSAEAAEMSQYISLLQSRISAIKADNLKNAIPKVEQPTAPVDTTATETKAQLERDIANSKAQQNAETSKQSAEMNKVAGETAKVNESVKNTTASANTFNNAIKTWYSGLSSVKDVLKVLYAVAENDMTPMDTPALKAAYAELTNMVNKTVGLSDEWKVLSMHIRKASDLMKSGDSAGAKQHQKHVEELIATYTRLKNEIIQAEAAKGQMGMGQTSPISSTDLGLDEAIASTQLKIDELIATLNRARAQHLKSDLDAAAGAANGAAGAVNQIDANMDGANASTSTIRRLMDKVKAAFERVVRASSRYVANANSATSATRRQANATRDMATHANKALMSFKNISRIVSGIMISQTFYAGLNAVREFVAEIATAHQKVEDMTVSFGVMMRSFPEATDYISVLRQFAAETPFRFEEVAKNAKMMKAYGFEIKSILPMMRMLSDASAAFGDSGAFERIVRALGQMHTKGRLMQEEVRQLTEVGINMSQILQEELGLTQKQLQNIGKLNIPAQTAIKAILIGIQKQFGGASKYLSNTVSGMLSTIRDNFVMIGAELTKPFFNAFKKSMTELRDNTLAIMEQFKTTGIGGVFEAVFTPEAQAAIRNVLAGIMNLWNSIKMLGAAIWPVINEFLILWHSVAGLVLPIFSFFTQILAGVIGFFTQSTVMSRILAGALMVLAAAVTANFVITKVVAAYKAFMALKGVQFVCLSLARAFNFLTVSMAANPLMTGAVLAAGAVAVALAAKFNTLGKAITGVGDAANKSAGVDPNKILKPETNKKTENLKDKYDDINNLIGDAGKNTDKLGDKTDKAGKKAKKAALSFDELYQITKDEDGAGDIDFDDLENNLNEALAGLGDLSIPIEMMPELPEEIPMPEVDMPTLDFGEMLWELGKFLGDCTMAISDFLGITFAVGAVADTVWMALQVTERFVGAVAKTIGVTGKALGQTFGEIASMGSQIYGHIKEWTGGVAQIGAQAFTDLVASWDRHITPWFGRSIDGFYDWFTSTASGLGEWAGNSIDLFYNWFLETSGGFVEWSAGTIGSIIQWGIDSGSEFATWFGETATGFAEWGAGTLQGLLDWENWSWESIVQWGSDTWDSLSTWWDDTTGGFGTWCSDNFAGISTWASDTWTSLSTWGSDTWTGLSTWWSDTTGGFSTWCSDTWTSIKDWAADTGETWSTWGSESWTTLSTAWGDFWTLTKDKCGDIGTTISTSWDNIKTYWSDWGTQVGVIWDNFWSDVKRIMGNWIDNIVQGFWDWMDALLAPFKWLADKIGWLFGGVQEDVADTVAAADAAGRNIGAPTDAMKGYSITHSYDKINEDVNMAMRGVRNAQSPGVLTGTVTNNSTHNTTNISNIGGKQVDMPGLIRAIAAEVAQNMPTPVYAGNIIATKRDMEQFADKISVIQRGRNGR